MPIKSTGCLTCRKRKIRCDETRPACNRCKTHGVTCPGYRLPAPGQVLFRDQTEWTVKNAEKVYKNKKPGASGSFRDGEGESPSSLSGSEGVVATSSSASSPEWEEKSHESINDFAKAMMLYASPQHLPSSAVEKQLIYSTFMDTYLPHRIGSHDAHFSFLQHLITSSDLRPEVANSLDAMSMVQVGSLYKDKGLLRQSVSAYHKAISGLLKTLSSTDTDVVRDDYVLATVNILANCEFFDEIAQIGDGWTKHVHGSQQLLAARGPNSITSNLSLLLYSNMRHGALSHSLIIRKACFLGSREWRAVAWRAPYIDSATFLYDTALQVPAVLERYDKLDFQSPNIVQDIDNLLSESRNLEIEMRAWFRDYQSRSKWNDQKLYKLAPIDDFETFTSLCKDRTLKEAFTFPNFMVSYLICVYWDVMHFLRLTIQQLHRHKHNQLDHWFPEPDEAVTDDEMMEYTMNLCRCFPYFVEPVSSSTGHIGMFLPLRTAAVHFSQHGEWAMLKWCGVVRDHAFTKGMRPPNVRARDPEMAPKRDTVFKA